MLSRFGDTYFLCPPVRKKRRQEQLTEVESSSDRDGE
jgi:hypothetical protein